MQISQGEEILLKEVMADTSFNLINDKSYFSGSIKKDRTCGKVLVDPSS